MAKYNNSVVTASTPRMGNPVTRAIGQFILNILGWKIVGQLPDHKKLIIVGMPHTSNWDFIIAMASIQSVGLKVSYMMKKEAFFWPLGGLFKWMGGIPIDRSSKNDITTQMVEYFENHDNVWLGITPEGTRSKVKRYKKGYLRIAKAADVPIAVIGINGATKEVILPGGVWEMNEDNNDLENAKIKAFVDENFVGINPENQ